MDKHEAAVKAAELKIQEILFDLSENTGREIDQVQVDTRRFGNLKVEIFFEGGPLAEGSVRYKMGGS